MPKSKKEKEKKTMNLWIGTRNCNLLDFGVDIGDV